MLVDGVRLVEGSRIDLGVTDSSRKGTAFPSNPAANDTFELTAAVGGNAAGVYWYHGGEWVLKTPDRSAVPYDISGGSVGKLAAQAIVSRLVVVRAFAFSLGFSGSFAVAGQAPAANTSIEIRRIDRSGADSKVGEIQFSLGSTVGIFVQNNAGTVFFGRGETLYLKGPDTADTSLSDLAFTLAGYLV